MSLPPLPEPFGNNALRGMAEVVPPDSVSWLPQTPGWLLVGGVLAVLSGRYCLRRFRAWHADRYRREAKRRLQALDRSADDNTFLGALNTLLKLTAMAAYSREQVAHLSGEQWTQFLNAHCPGAPFSDRASHALVEGLYSGNAPEGAVKAELVTASALWIERHRHADDA